MSVERLGDTFEPELGRATTTSIRLEVRSSYLAGYRKKMSRTSTTLADDDEHRREHDAARRRAADALSALASS